MSIKVTARDRAGVWRRVVAIPFFLLTVTVLSVTSVLGTYNNSGTISGGGGFSATSSFTNLGSLGQFGAGSSGSLYQNATVLLPASEALKASYATLTVTAGSGGTTNPSGTLSIPLGGNQTFYITAASGYRILDVSVDGSSLGAIPSYTFTGINADHTITASFVQQPAGVPVPAMGPLGLLMAASALALVSLRPGRRRSQRRL